MVSHYRQDITSNSLLLGGLGEVIYPAHVRVETPTCDVRRGRLKKNGLEWLITNTPTWWYNMSPLNIWLRDNDESFF